MIRAIGCGLLALLVSCGPATERSDTVGDRDTSGMADMPGMGGAAGAGGMGAMMSAAMMDSMEAHMRSMETMSTDQAQAMLPMHRQMMANTLAQMNREMQAMSMRGDARWTALLDSVRQDLVRIPDLSAPQVKSFMPAHAGRAARLMQLHRDMMKGMNK